MQLNNSVKMIAPALAATSTCLAIAISVYFNVHGADNYAPLWKLNNEHQVPFSVPNNAVCIFWSLLFSLQLAYTIKLLYLTVKHEERDGSPLCMTHYIISNVLHAVFVVVFAQSLFAWAEVVLVLNFINLSALYFRHHTGGWLEHQAVICGPLAWAFVAIYWNGFIMAPSEPSNAVRIVGAVLVWSFFGYGLFFILAYQDIAIALYLSALSIAISFGQAQRLGSGPEIILPLVVAVLLLAVVVTSMKWPRLGYRGNSNTQTDLDKQHGKEDV